MTILQGGTRNVLTKSNQVERLGFGNFTISNSLYAAFNYLGVAKELLQLMTIFMLLDDRVPKTF
jgi:hypothetical protein